MPNLARNFGIISLYIPIGTTLYSYLYAYLVARHTTSDEVCYGRICWELTFWVCLTTSLVSVVLSFVLWRRWKGML